MLQINFTNFLKPIPLLFIPAFLLLATSILAQPTPCDRPTYTDFIAKAQNLVEAGDYIQAFQYYNSAKDYCPQESAAVDELVERLIAKIAEDQQITEDAKQNVQLALDKANKLINVFYFYANRFALTYGETDNGLLFYFIDKDGNEVSKLGRWQRAEPFNQTGYATVTQYTATIVDTVSSYDFETYEELIQIVRRPNLGFTNAYLLDTFGNTYTLARKLTDDLEHVEAIDFTRNDLDTLPAQAFRNEQLKIALLDDNRFDKTDLSGINACSSLKKLLISNNDFESLFDITGLSNLEILQADHNNLVWIPESIEKLKNATHLNFSNNLLIELPASFHRLSNLKELNLGKNRLRHLPDSLHGLLSLQKLVLTDNALSTLPESLNALHHLLYLDVSYNQLKQLPKNIGELYNLTYLDLKGNSLRHLPEDLGNMRQLHYLKLRGNNLTDLPESLGELYLLDLLDVSDNELVRLPENVGELSALTYLDLSGNNLSDLPESLGALKHLRHLDLRGNGLLLPDEIGLISAKLPDTKIYTPDANSYYWSSSRAFNNRDYPLACQLMRAAIQLQQLDYKYWYGLSFYTLFVNEYDAAITAATKTLELNPEAVGVETNLALGYLLNGQWNEAKAIYQKRKNQPFPNDPDNRSWSQVFLQDITDLETAGISHPDFAKVKTLLED